MEHVLESGMPPLGKLVSSRERSREYGERRSGSEQLSIAVLAPPWFPVPPERYGGTEAVVSLLVEGLVAEGHDVTLFATGDSTTSANLVSYFGRSRPDSLGTTQADMLQVLSCIAEADRFDVVSDHTGALGLSLSNLTTTPFLNTVHGALANLALALLGKIAVNLNYTAGQNLVDSSVDQCKITHVLTSRRVLDKFKVKPAGELILLEDVPKKVTTADKIFAASVAKAVPIAALGWFLPGLRGGGELIRAVPARARTAERICLQRPGQLRLQQHRDDFSRVRYRGR